MGNTMHPEPAKFRASHLKLARAKKHFCELQLEVGNYLATGPVSLIWERTPWTDRFAGLHPRDTELVGLVARIRHSVPEILSPIIGDVVHNLRSALDIMMCELVTKADRAVNARRTGFPFWGDGSESLETQKSEAFRKSNVERAGNNVVLLVEAWEPFPGGKSRLYALHDLWNMDKHRSIIPVMTGIEYSQNQAACGHLLKGQLLVDPFPTRTKATDGQVFVVAPQEGGPQIGTRVPCTCSLGLDASEAKGRTLLGELERQIDIVHGALVSFETGKLPTFLPPPAVDPVRVGNGAWIFPPSMSPEEVLRWTESDTGKQKLSSR